MSDDLSQELRAFEGSEALANGDFSVCIRSADRIEAQAAEITRLRAACDAYFKTISLSQMRHGRILVGLERRNARQRRVLAKLYQRRHEKNVALATARREGMKEAAQRLEELHKNNGYNPQTGEVWRLGKLITCPLTIDHAIGYYRAIAEGVAHILAAAKEDNRPSEEIIREDRDAWPDHQANDPIRAAAKEGE